MIIGLLQTTYVVVLYWYPAGLELLRQFVMFIMCPIDVHTYVPYWRVPYWRVIKRIHLYLHRKKACTYQCRQTVLKVIAYSYSMLAITRYFSCFMCQFRQHSVLGLRTLPLEILVYVGDDVLGGIIHSFPPSRHGRNGRFQRLN